MSLAASWWDLDRQGGGRPHPAQVDYDEGEGGDLNLTIIAGNMETRMSH